MLYNRQIDLNDQASQCIDEFNYNYIIIIIIIIVLNLPLEILMILLY